MKTCFFIFIALVVVALFPSCSSTGPNTQRGAATGAVAGAVIGGIIGHQSGETGAGAALGAAAGGLAGGAYGNKKDSNESSRGIGQDSYGYTAADYLALLEPEEKNTLQSRAPNQYGTELANYLTAQEKSNLRARAASRQEIGR